MLQLDLSQAVEKLDGMWHLAVAQLPNLIIAMVVYGVFWFLGKFTRNLLTRLIERGGRPRSASLAVGRLVGWVVNILGLLIALIILVPSLDTSSLFGALGIGGVAIGFAFKDIFQNLLAGVLLLLTRPFKIGDQIVSGNHTGTVEDIQVRATLLRTPDNRLVVVPNSDLYTGRVEVNTARDRRRVSVVFEIDAANDIELAKETILGEIAESEKILDTPPPSVVATHIEGDVLRLTARFWVGPPRQTDLVAATDYVITKVTPALIAGGIRFPAKTIALKNSQASA